jgi:hypothetical protein
MTGNPSFFAKDFARRVMDPRVKPAGDGEERGFDSARLLCYKARLGTPQ